MMRPTPLDRTFQVDSETHVQLNLAITDLKGPTIFNRYRRIFTIANIRNKEKPCQGTTKVLQFSSVIGGFPLLLDPI